jgi:signal peptidase I
MGDAVRGSARVVVLCIVLLLSLGVLFLSLGFELEGGAGWSMNPTLYDGDRVILDTFAYGARIPLVGWELPALGEPRRGDVVALTHPRIEGGKQRLGKRIVGLPGETIQVRDNRVKINGRVLSEPYIPENSFPTAPSDHCDDQYACEPFTLGANSYFVLGDNRFRSGDSRHLGPIERGWLEGRIVVIFSRSTGYGSVYTWERVGP